jgi:hypothetical protein
MSRYCKCVGWSEKYQCRDGISWNGDGEEFQAHPPGKRCRCADDCCWDHCQCAVQEVPPIGTFLVIDGVVKRVDSHDYTPGLPWVGVHLEDE